jgi:hypothetical protein
VGGPQKSSTNRKIHKLVDFGNYLDLRTFHKCDTLRICDLRTQHFFVICGLKTSASPQIQTFPRYYLQYKALILKIRGKRRLLGLFRDKVVQYFVLICRFAICGLLKKICGLAICGLTYLRNLQISDCVMCTRIYGFVICGLKKNFTCPPLTIRKNKPSDALITFIFLRTIEAYKIGFLAGGSCYSCVQTRNPC